MRGLVSIPAVSDDPLSIDRGLLAELLWGFFSSSKESSPPPAVRKSLSSKPLLRTPKAAACLLPDETKSDGSA